MSFLNFGNKAKAGDTICSIDVGSGTVTVSLVSFDRKGEICTPKILFTEANDMPIIEDLNFDLYIKQMDIALKKGLESLMYSATGVPSQIHIFLASPWYASETRVIKVTKTEAFLFTEKNAKSLIDEEIERFKAEQKARYKEAGGEINIIEKHIINAKINGYRTKDPYKKKAKEVELSLFISVAPSNVSDHITETVEKVLHKRKIIFHSFIFGSFIVARDLFQGLQSFLLLDIGSEVTDVGIVKDGELGASISFPAGKNFILRRIVAENKSSIEEAKSLFTLYQDKKLEDKSRISLEAILESARKEWLTQFQNALYTISHDFLLPDSIILTIDQDVSIWFMESIRKEAFSQYTMTEKEFTVTFFNKETLAQYVSFGPKGKANPFSMIESLALCRL